MCGFCVAERSSGHERSAHVAGHALEKGKTHKSGTTPEHGALTRNSGWFALSPCSVARNRGDPVSGFFSSVRLIFFVCRVFSLCGAIDRKRGAQRRPAVFFVSQS
jgi:hypothetical protein